MEINSYESVDDGSPSWVTSQKSTKTNFRQLMVKINFILLLNKIKVVIRACHFAYLSF